MKKISEWHEYIAGYIVLANLQLDNLPEAITVDGTHYVKKSEFHVTLVCVKRIVEMLGAGEDRAEEITELFKQFITTAPINKFNLLPEFRLVQRDERKTIVVMVHVENLKNFFDLLRKKYELDVPYQPAHVTIYSLQPEVGISLSSEEDVRRDTKVAEIPELSGVKPA